VKYIETQPFKEVGSRTRKVY